MRIALVVSIMVLSYTSICFAENSQPVREGPKAQNADGTGNKNIRSELSSFSIITSHKNKANKKTNPSDNETEKYENIAIQKRIANYTGMLAFLAFLQFIAMGIQARFLCKTLSATKEAANAAQQAAEAAELNARAAIGIELPIIRAITSDLLSTGKLIADDRFCSGTVNTGIPNKYSAIGHIQFVNYGRTPAFPEMISVGWMVAARLPDNPILMKTAYLSHAAVINPNEDFVADTCYGIELSEGELITIKNAHAWLWFYGRIYYTDFMTTKREARFCWRFTDHGYGNYRFFSDGEPPAEYTHYA